MFHTIRWRIAIPYVVLILLSTLGLTFFISKQVRKVRLADLETQLLAEARVLADSLQPLMAQGESADALDSLARRWADLLGARITIIGVDGTVLGESQHDRTAMGNHLDRPEVQQALTNGQGSSIRFSQTIGYEMMYVALPVRTPSGGRMMGVVRVALPLRQIEASVGRLRQTILTAGLFTVLLAALMALLIAERTARPVRRLTDVAERMAEGDLAARLLPTGRDEVGQLTLAFNHMADQLREKMTTLAEEQDRLAVVLEHMADGVLITDATGRVQLINPAAARLLGTTQPAALGRSFVQVVRDYRLVELWENCCEQSEEQSAAVELDRLGLFLQVIVTPLQEITPPPAAHYAAGGTRMDLQPKYTQTQVIILQDLTQIRRLNAVRRDFISNISHELRTPLASLKALVDTLRDGALDDPPAAQRFLDRIETEVDAMTQMVQELLELSRIESGRVPLSLVPTPVADVVVPPVERLYPQAERAGLSLTVDLPSDLPQVLADAERVRQVVTNLVHNAIKFTRTGGRVTVRAYPVQDKGQRPKADRYHSAVIIEVADTGVGIPADDLPRIFERFYKADRARSGGGTGLGLAIAKHVVQGHGGRIWAESIEGQGSTFYFTLLALV
ncbi:MAG: ATP-binding protein [Anaerolineae bacterium]|jgi:two-component system phosphate regulon sensor histidine kinase PhoR